MKETFQQEKSDVPARLWQREADRKPRRPPPNNTARQHKKIIDGPCAMWVSNTQREKKKNMHNLLFKSWVLARPSYTHHDWDCSLPPERSLWWRHGTRVMTGGSNSLDSLVNEIVQTSLLKNPDDETSLARCTELIKPRVELSKKCHQKGTLLTTFFQPKRHQQHQQHLPS